MAVTIEMVMQQSQFVGLEEDEFWSVKGVWQGVEGVLGEFDLQQDF